jgi:NAD dependent epimerase/dehydratase family enzyme
MADALLLSSQRVLPQKVQASGYLFSYQRLEESLQSVLGR